MTWDIALVLTILVVSVVLFVTEKLRMDVVALLVLGVLGMTRLVSPEEALEGFSNQAVVTVWAMFILSAGLTVTGVANIIGQQVLKIAGRTEPRIIITIMISTAVMSAFMSNIGVAALMLPIVMDIARKTQTSPSRLLMPMAYASLLGGLTTLIGTPPNLVASNALVEAELEGFTEGFTLFDFAPIGVPALIAGTLFVAFFGRKMLPGKLPDSFEAEMDSNEFRYSHQLGKKHYQLNVTKESPFVGKRLADTQLGPILGFHVDVIKRGNEELPVIGGDIELQAGDGLVVQGKVSDFEAFGRWQAFEMASGAEIAELLALQKLVLISAEIKEGSTFDGLTVKEADFRRRFDSHILSIRNEDGLKRGNMTDHVFRAGDRLQIETKKDNLEVINDSDRFENIELIAEESIADIYPDSDSLVELSIPEDSHIVGLKLKETGLSEDLNLRILGIARKTGSILIPSGDEEILRGDKLLIHGNKSSLELIRGLQTLALETDSEVEAPSAPANHAMSEVTLAPQSSMVGQSLKKINFRNRFGLQVESIWRRGKSYRSHLRNMSLEFGDALLISGPRGKLDELAENDDFLVLTAVNKHTEETGFSKTKAIIAAAIMIATVVIVLVDWVPIAVAAVAGSAVMIACRCLSIEEAYKAIEWKSVFLIACMIPLGAAMKDTGAAELLAKGVSAVAKPFGVWGLIIGLYIMTALATTIVPTAALVVIMASIGIDASRALGVAPEMVVMAIAMAASASFTSPISHPANVLVMGPGGYRFIDYIKMGVLLALVVMITVLPMIWFIYR